MQTCSSVINRVRNNYPTFMCLLVPHNSMEPFEGLDFYDIESLLTEEEIMIRDMVRDWVDEEVLPKIEHACEEGVFPDEWRVALGEMGVLGAPLKGYDCPGLSYVAYGLICQELERGDSGYVHLPVYKVH